MKIWLIALLLLFATLPAGANLPAANLQQQVHIGILNYESKDILGSRWEALQTLLNSHLGNHRVELKLLDNSALAQMVANRSLDFVITNPSHYIQLRHQFGLSSPLATLVRQHQGTPIRAFGGVIFTRAEIESIRTLEDISSRRIATIGTSGFAGFLLQASTLLEATGKRLKDNQLVVTGQPQNKVVEAVLEGRADVGFVRTGMLESLAELGKLDLDQVKVINQQFLPGYPFVASTILHPEWPVAAIPHTQRELVNQIAGLLLQLGQQDRPVSPDLYGFDVPEDYLAAQEILRTLRAPPFDAPLDIEISDVWENFKLYAMIVIALAVSLLAGIGIFFRVNLALSKAREEAETQRQRLRNILWGTNAGTWEWHIPDGQVHFNERWAEIIGYSLEELAPLSIDTWTQLTHPDDLKSSEKALQAVFNREHETYECEVRMQHKQGHWVWILDRGKVTDWGTDGKPLHMAGTHTDINDKKKSEKKLQQIASTDALTGLCNRRALIDRLKLAMAFQSRRKGYLAVVFLDLDGFKEINDRHGHEAGDQVLKKISQRFLESVREEDTVARIGGDEFVLVLNGLNEENSCQPLVERLMAATARPVRTNSATLQVTGSAGVTIFPQLGFTDYSELFRQADAAMYQAKQAGKSQFKYAHEAQLSREAKFS